ncbi:MAG: hypothetical protein K2L95_01000 [Alphaproteobacteria bacterium]|nr:hypothetical protein [Alphaproteobacteria bacterium]
MKLKFTVPYILAGMPLLMGINNLSANETAHESNTPDNIAAKQHTVDTVMSITEIPTVISVRDMGRDVIYVYDNGAIYSRRGGTRAWRNNNPGCIRYSDFARQHGAIGQAGKFAVFPDAETGAAAIGALLQTDKYRNLTMAAAIAKYAPPHENDTRGYLARLTRMTGVPATTKLCNLNNNQLNMVVDAIRVLEGWRPGNEIAVKSVNDSVATKTHNDTVVNPMLAQIISKQRQMSL